MLRVFRHYIPGLSLVLLGGDLGVILGSVYLSDLFGYWHGAGPMGLKLGLVTVTIAFMLHLGDLYNTRLPLGRREMVARLLTCQAVAGLLVAAVGFALPVFALGRAMFLQVGATTTLGLVG